MLQQHGLPVLLEGATETVGDPSGLWQGRASLAALQALAEVRCCSMRCTSESAVSAGAYMSEPGGECSHGHKIMHVSAPHLRPTHLSAVSTVPAWPHVAFCKRPSLLWLAIDETAHAHVTLQVNASLKQDVLRSLQQLVPTMIAAATGGADLAHPQHGQDMAQQQRHNQQMLQAVLVMQRQLLCGGTPEQPAMAAEQLETAQALAKGLLTGAAQLMKVTRS